jgi:hypothetical protein
MKSLAFSDAAVRDFEGAMKALKPNPLKPNLAPSLVQSYKRG